MLMLMLYTCTYAYLLGGPLTPYSVTDADNCRDLWWKNLLMISNFTQLGDTVSKSGGREDRREEGLT